MHILMVAPQPFFRPRGTPFSVMHRIRGLRRLGHTVELVTYPFGESPAMEGLTIHRAARPPFVRDVGIGPSFAKILLDVPLFRLAAKLAASGRFDLLHTHEEAGWIGARLRRTLGLPHLYDMHSSLPQQFENFGRFNWPPVVATFRGLERYTLNGSDAVIAICAELHEHVLASGYDRPLALIENTLDFDVPEPTPTALHELRRQLQLEDARVVLYTGTLEPYQGLDLLLEAAALVVADAPDAVFVLVGGTAEQSEKLRAQTQLRGLEHAFRFITAVEPTAVFLYHRLADVLVTARSRGTNTPLKIYQYMRADRPIVATDIRSHTQVLDDTTAEMVQPEAHSIARGILRVLNDPDRARRLAANAAARARDRYGEESYMRRLSTLLEQLQPAPTPLAQT